MNKYVIIVAGGSGTRMRAEIPKQFLLINNLPVLQHTIAKFYNYDSAIQIVVVLPETQIAYWQELCMKYNFKIEHNIIAGGDTRFQSVKNGLLSITEKEGVVAIHDGVRPSVSNDVISNCFDTAAKIGNAIPSVSVNDSLRIVKENVSKIVDRSEYRIVQTPQVFQLSIIKKAFDVEYQSQFTDDASVAEYNGLTINLVEGNFENIKITTPSDLLIAKAFLGN